MEGNIAQLVEAFPRWTVVHPSAKGSLFRFGSGSVPGSRHRSLSSFSNYATTRYVIHMIDNSHEKTILDALRRQNGQ